MVYGAREDIAKHEVREGAVWKADATLQDTLAQLHDIIVRLESRLGPILQPLRKHKQMKQNLLSRRKQAGPFSAKSWTSTYSQSHRHTIGFTVFFVGWKSKLAALPGVRFLLGSPAAAAF